LIHFHFDTKNTLPEEDVTDGIIDKVANWLTGMDHKTIGKLHRFCTGGPKLARNYNFTTLGTRLHHKSEDTIAGTLRGYHGHCQYLEWIESNIPADGKTTQEFVAKRLALSDSRKSTMLNFFGVKFEGVFREFESLLDEGGKFANAAALLTQDILGMGRTNNNLITFANHISIN